ncbi:MAG: class D sortase [Lachnospiraceae bacterium]|nr:class D sortase [Lachnospiraceae bacterium]
MQKHKSRFAKKLNRVMAYIYMPLLFSLLAYGVTYLMASDVIDIAVNLVSLISADKAPDFTNENNSIFVKDSVEINDDDGVLTVKRADVGMADYGDLYAYVRCTRIALDAPVYYGDDDAILKKGVGQDFASSQPGFGRLIVLCAHNNMYFNALKNIEIGDIVEIETSYGTYSYEIKETKILNENDSSAFDFAIDHEQLVMYTCYPFDMLAHTPDRFFVYADLVSGPVFVD